jgi:kinesin family protein C1
LNGESQDESGLTKIQFPSEKKDTIELYQSVETASGNLQSKTYPFSFDKVFQPNVPQAEVFEEISQLVQSALDGYNICIFAYGQTGSGKTYTMEGPDKLHGPDDVHTGMIPRAVKQIYSAAEKLKEKGWAYSMEAQFLEIYNETLRDLLSKDNETKKHEIRHDNAKARTTVTDATNIVVDTPEAVFELLDRASKNRAVAATNCNERSSRSHSVFTLRLTGTNTVTDETCYGVLNLIDLAGSERLSSSGSTGERLKETQAINKSLSCLGDVIYSLANKDAHIPYRNSKVFLG